MSKIKELSNRVKEYKRLKKIADRWSMVAWRFYSPSIAVYGNISRIHDTETPHVAPTKWGTDGFPCRVVNENFGKLNPYVLDYNIGSESNYVFQCPYYHEDRPCANLTCQYNQNNQKYFLLTDKYNQAFARYEAARARANEAWKRIFRPNRSK